MSSPVRRAIGLRFNHMIGPTTRGWLSGAAIAVSIGVALAGLLVWPQDSEGRLARAPAGTVFRDCPAGSPACPEMVVLPAGSFTMGTRESGRDFITEQPRRRITLARFAVSKYEITFAQWRACVAGGGCAGYLPDQDGMTGEERPVASVKWAEANGFADWLSKTTGHSYRLLTEAEWEYAARAVGGPDAPDSKFSWGNDDPVCTKGARNGASSGNCMPHQTEPVGSYQPNAFGLYDMHGNVWEWVEDCYRDTLAGQPANGAAVTQPKCAFHVVRGGSWITEPHLLRSADRSFFDPDDRDSTIGFRVARVLPIR